MAIYSSGIGCEVCDLIFQVKEFIVRVCLRLLGSPGWGGGGGCSVVVFLSPGREVCFFPSCWRVWLFGISLIGLLSRSSSCNSSIEAGCSMVVDC